MIGIENRFIPESEIERRIEETQSDFRLSPEAEAKLMEKVQDIDTNGLAYSTLDYSKLGRDPKQAWDDEKNIIASCFDSGLLGKVSEYPEGEKPVRSEQPRATKWALGSRKQKEGNVYFNIVGRSRDALRGDKTQIESTVYAGSPDSVTIIFDLSSYKEIAPKDRPPGDNDRAVGYKKFTAFQYYHSRGEYKIGESKNSPDFGFVLSYRIPPREFMGIAISNMTLDTSLEGGMRHLSTQELKARAEEVSILMLKYSHGESQSLIPIYDISGNLLWPRQMNYNAVKNWPLTRKAKENENRLSS